MYVSRVVFRGIIAQVFLPELIVKLKVFLRFAIKKPEVLHLHCAGVLAFDGIVDNANGGNVIYVNWRWWLWVFEFGKSESEDFGFLCIEKEGTQFGFGGGCGNKFEYCTHDVDGNVEFDRIAINRETAEEEVATSTALCTRGRKIRCIGVDVEYHVRGAVSYNGVRVHPHVSKELVNQSLGVFDWRRLLSGDVG